MHKLSPLTRSVERSRYKYTWRPGFTIVELLIVVVVIAILAAITIVAYNGITAQARDSSLKADLTNGAKQLHLAKVEDGSFPANKPSYLGSDIQYSQTNGGQGFCITSSKDGKAFSMTHATNPAEGTCTGHTVVGGGSGGGGGGNEIAANSPIQNVTSAQCQALPEFTGSNTSAIRTVIDSRGGTTQTYEIAKLADNNCWMLTNLKLGSTSEPVTLTPADSDVAGNFTLPQVTTSGTLDYDNPRAHGPLEEYGDTGSGATNYGYLYNWSAATAGESRTTHDHTKGNAPHSICPAGWRLPSAGTYDPSTWPYTLVTPGDFSGLDIAFGGTGNYKNNGEPNIARWQYSGPFKGVFSGRGGGGFGVQGVLGSLWSRSAYPDDSYGAFAAYFYTSEVYPGDGYYGRDYGLAVRCLLN